MWMRCGFSRVKLDLIDRWYDSRHLKDSFGLQQIEVGDPYDLQISYYS